MTKGSERSKDDKANGVSPAFVERYLNGDVLL